MHKVNFAFLQPEVEKQHVLKVLWLFKHVLTKLLDSNLINFGTYLGRTRSQQVNKDSLRLGFNKQVPQHNGVEQKRLNGNDCTYCYQHL